MPFFKFYLCLHITAKQLESIILYALKCNYFFNKYIQKNGLILIKNKLHTLLNVNLKLLYPIIHNDMNMNSSIAYATI